MELQRIGEIVSTTVRPPADELTAWIEILSRVPGLTEKALYDACIDYKGTLRRGSFPLPGELKDFIRINRRRVEPPRGPVSRLPGHVGKALGRMVHVMETYYQKAKRKLPNNEPIPRLTANHFWDGEAPPLAVKTHAEFFDAAEEVRRRRAA